jgi:hypothetical protein
LLLPPEVADANSVVVAETDVPGVSPATDRMRRVNELISESLARGRDQPTALFCECADPDCYRVVWLSPAEYLSGRRNPLWIAVSGEHGDSRMRDA